MFNGTTFHSYMYAVLAGLICTSNKWANYHRDSFPSPFPARTMLWTVIRSFAGPWTPALSRYTTAQLMRWHVI